MTEKFIELKIDGKTHFVALRTKSDKTLNQIVEELSDRSGNSNVEDFMIEDFIVEDLCIKAVCKHTVILNGRKTKMLGTDICKWYLLNGKSVPKHFKEYEIKE